MLYLNTRPVSVTQFPDKTSQVWKIPDEHISQDNYIHWKFESEAELVHLTQLVQLIDNHLVPGKPRCRVTCLTIGFLPYGRQDKDISNSTTFALHTFSRLYNSLQVPTTYILDPHANDISRWIFGAVHVFPLYQLGLAVQMSGADAIVYPDEGAAVRYARVSSDIAPSSAHIWANKVRNQSTGQIEGIEVDARGAKNVLVIDDICDGGATFIALAEKLKDQGVQKLSLYVTHGLFTKGIEPLARAGYSHIYTGYEDIQLLTKEAGAEATVIRTPLFCLDETAVTINIGF